MCEYDGVRSVSGKVVFSARKDAEAALKQEDSDRYGKKEPPGRKPGRFKLTVTADQFQAVLSAHFVILRKN